MVRTFSFLLQGAAIVGLLMVFSRCAQVAPLTGGNKDIAPPMVKSSNPENAARNFTGKVITLQMDEYIVLKDLSNQVIITPQVKSSPDISVRGKQIRIQFYDPLAANTTYRIFFGNAITDLHEGNVLSGYEFVFSTGPTIDSLKIAGHINTAFNNKPGSEALVALYDAKDADSIVYREKPAYMSKSDADGNFQMNYLHPGAYKLLAFTDLNKNLLYDAGEESVAFLPKPINVQKDTTVRLELFKEIPSKTYLKKSFSVFYGRASLIFNKPYINYEIEPLKAHQKEQIQIIRNTIGDTAAIFYSGIYDTLALTIHYPERQLRDTLLVTVLSQQDYNRQIKDKKMPLTFTSNFSGGRLSFHHQPVLSYVRELDPNSVKAAFAQMRFSAENDSLVATQKDLFQFEAPNKIRIRYDLHPGTEYKLYIPAGILKDRLGIGNDSTLATIKTSTPEDEGRLALKLFFPKKENYIVQLLNDKDGVAFETTVELSLTSSSEKIVQIPYLLPGPYTVKVIEDLNKNGRWDTGDFLQHRFPERVYTNTVPIKILADWDIEAEWKVE